MGSARNKMDILPRGCEPCTEVAADATCRHHHDFHAPLAPSAAYSDPGTMLRHREVTQEGITALGCAKAAGDVCVWPLEDLLRSCTDSRTDCVRQVDREWIHFIAVRPGHAG